MKENKYKMIVLDLDGTLTNDKKEITPKTCASLMEAQERGIKVVLASGRPTLGIVHLVEQLHLADYGGYILAYNGGKIIDCKTKETVNEQFLQPDLVPLLYNKAMQSQLSILTYQAEGIATTNKNDEYVQHEAFINQMNIVQLDNFLHQIVYPINKCLIVGEPTILAQVEKDLSLAVEGKMCVYRSAPFFLECVPLGVDKAKSLDYLLKTIDIQPEEIIACGDGYNDISMLQYVGLGVAMQNAPNEVKNIANYVTLSNEEDGVAHVIEKFLL